MTDCKIESIGICLPSKTVSTASIVKRAKMISLKKLEYLSGIKNRYFCSGKEDAFSLSLGAIHDCMLLSDYQLEEIEMIIYCAISRLRSNFNVCHEPSMSTLIKNELGLTNVLNFDLSNACAGMATALHIADDFISRGVVKNCLMVSGEYISTISENAAKEIKTIHDPEIASLTVGDAGNAVLIDRADDDHCISCVDLKAISSYSDLCIGTLSRKYPGAQMFTQMSRLHKVSIALTPKYIEETLKKNGLKYGDIDVIIPHQTAKKAIEDGAKQLRSYFKGKQPKIIINLENFGNTASNTHFFTLYHLLKKKQLNSNDSILLLIYASGLIIGTVVLKPGKLVEKYGK